MRLGDFLQKYRVHLTARWIEAANAVYPFAAVGFLQSRQNPFANPIGCRSRDLSELFFTAILGATHDGTALRDALEEFVRVRAMQDCPADVSLQVMFAYKNIIRTYVAEHGIAMNDAMYSELERIDERCDALALLSFDMYVRFREVFHSARVDDIRRRHSQVMRLARQHGFAVEEEEDGLKTGGLCQAEPPSRY